MVKAVATVQTKGRATCFVAAILLTLILLLASRGQRSGSSTNKGCTTCLVAAILLTLVLCLASDKVTVSVLWKDESIKVIDIYFLSG